MRQSIVCAAGAGLALLSGVVIADAVTVNPWLAQGAYPISHHDAAQTDSTWVDGPDRGGRLRTDQVKSVPLLWSSAPTYKMVSGERIVVAANPAGIIKVRATDHFVGRCR